MLEAPQGDSETKRWMVMEGARDMLWRSRNVEVGVEVEAAVEAPVEASCSSRRRTCRNVRRASTSAWLSCSAYGLVAAVRCAGGVHFEPVAREIVW